MIPSKLKYLAVVISLILCYYWGYSQKHEVIKRELEIVEVEKVVEKDIVRYIKRPDGTTETIIDRSKETINEETKKISIIKYLEKQYIVGLSGGSTIDFKSKPVYTFSVSKKAFLGAYIGLYGRTDKEVGLTISYLF